MKYYCQTTNKTVKELYLEADEEEEKGVRLHKRKYSHYIIKYKKELQNKDMAPITIRSYINAIKMFYFSLGIRPPELTVQKGDITLEKNYGHLLTKKEINQMLSVATSRLTAIIYTMALSGMSQREVLDLTLKKFVKSAGNAIDQDFQSVEDLFHYVVNYILFD